MKYASIPALAVFIVSAGCAKEPVAPAEGRTFALVATITESSQCTMSFLGKDYKSENKIRGDVPSKFIGTIPDKSYHGFGCVVDNPAGEGDLIIVFSGNRFGQPLAVGTYQLATDILNETPPMRANVTFRSAVIDAERFSTFDGARGSVVVDSIANGGRRVRVDVDVFLYQHPVF